MKTYRTSELAQAAGIHPNIVRRYVDWGLLPPFERSPSGYQRLTQKHLDCLWLAQLIYGQDYPGQVAPADIRVGKSSSLWCPMIGVERSKKPTNTWR